MPWEVIHNHPACRVGEWAVVNMQAEAEGRHSIEGCHPTKEKAQAQQRALYANEPKDLEMTGMEHKQLLAPVEWKAAAGTPGELEGYMSVFNTLDRDSDVVVPGAFRKTFADWNRANSPMPLIADHELSTDGVIGSVTHMVEDGYGAKVRARFSSTQKAQNIRTNMLEGHLSGMSYTYQVLRSRRGMFEGKAARFLDELRVFEATVSPFPVNQLALASAKADNAPYGNVAYADPGYQDDGQKRYPLDTEAHCRAAWSYINQADNAAKYSADELALVKGRIRAALKRYGVQVSESASLDFAAFSEMARKALEIGHETAAKAAFDLLLKDYTEAAGTADEPPTATAAATTDPQPGPAGGTAPPEPELVTAAQYALSIINPGPRDDAPTGEPPPALAYSQQLLENLRTQDDLERLEAEINTALGRTA